MINFKTYILETVGVFNIKNDITNNATGGKTEKISLHDSENEVGYIKVAIYPEYANITGLYVLPDYRNQGIAKKLIDTVIKKYDERAITITPYAYKDAPMSDEQLKTFYMKLGFEPDIYSTHNLIRTPKY